MKGLPVKVGCFRQDFSNVSIECWIGIPLVLLVISLYKLVSRNTAVFAQNMTVNSSSIPAISQLYLTGSTALSCGMCNTHTYLGNGCHYHVLMMWMLVFSNWHVTVHICIMLISIVVIQKGTTMTMTECCNSVPWK